MQRKRIYVHTRLKPNQHALEATKKKIEEEYSYVAHINFIEINLCNVSALLTSIIYVYTQQKFKQRTYIKWIDIHTCGGCNKIRPCFEICNTTKKKKKNWVKKIKIDENYFGWKLMQREKNYYKQEMGKVLYSLLVCTK